jgi:hypothetical protein
MLSPTLLLRYDRSLRPRCVLRELRCGASVGFILGRLLDVAEMPLNSVEISLARLLSISIETEESFRRGYFGYKVIPFRGSDVRGSERLALVSRLTMLDKL